MPLSSPQYETRQQKPLPRDGQTRQYPDCLYWHCKWAYSSLLGKNGESNCASFRANLLTCLFKLWGQFEYKRFQLRRNFVEAYSLEIYDTFDPDGDPDDDKGIAVCCQFGKAQEIGDWLGTRDWYLQDPKMPLIVDLPYYNPHRLSRHEDDMTVSEQINRNNKLRRTTG